MIVKVLLLLAKMWMLTLVHLSNNLCGQAYSLVQLNFFFCLAQSVRIAVSFNFTCICESFVSTENVSIFERFDLLLVGYLTLEGIVTAINGLTLMATARG